MTWLGLLKQVELSGDPMLAAWMRAVARAYIEAVMRRL